MAQSVNWLAQAGWLEFDSQPDRGPFPYFDMISTQTLIQLYMELFLQGESGRSVKLIISSSRNKVKHVWRLTSALRVFNGGVLWYSDSLLPVTVGCVLKHKAVLK